MQPAFQLAHQVSQTATAGDEAAAAIIGLLIGLVFFIIIIGINVAILGLIAHFAYVRPLKAVPESARTATPKSGYLAMIPIVNIIWIYTHGMNHVPNSLRAGFEQAGLKPVDDEEDFGKKKAMLSFLLLVPVIGIVGLVFQILYMIQVNGLAAQLKDATNCGDA